MLPDLAGRRVVDLGCGFGWFCRWARENGAAHVLGLDLSEKMLDRARTQKNDKAVIYAVANLEDLSLLDDGFHLAYSSLAFHYVEDAARRPHATLAGRTPDEAYWADGATKLAA
jgi:ubiquinone/menaquinone biosynthesis C-methylase UbiE